MEKRILGWIFLVLAIFAAGAQESFFDNYVYQNWNTLGDIKGATVTDLIQTGDGYLDIGTYDGLVQFDGVEFKTIRKSKSNDLKFSSVRVVYEDSNSNLWVGSNDEGLQKLSAAGNKLYTTENGLPNNSIRAITEDHNGNIWVGTAAGVVYITKEGRLITPQFEAGTVAKGVIAVYLYCDTAGRIWLITAGERGLFLFSDGLFRTRQELDEFGSYFASAIAQDLKGDFWVGLGTDGLVRIRNGHLSRIETGTFLDTSPTVAIHVSKNGMIWFGTESGVAVLDNGVFYENSMKNLANAKINKIICDREDNIWIATDRNGIGKLTQGKFRMKRTESSVNAIAEGLDGSFWIATNTGVLCYRNDKFVENELTEFTKGLRIRDVGVTSDGDILASCYKKPGQIRWGKRGIETWSTDEGLAGNKVRVAVETGKGELYVGTTTGLSIIHADGSIRNVKQADGLVNEYVMAIHKDKNDIVWIGTDGAGVYLMKDEKIFAQITSEDGLAGNIIFKITQDKNDVYWICTGTGITRIPIFDVAKGVPSEFQNLNGENGLGTDSVFQIISDQRGSDWITSNYGIASVKNDELIEAADGRIERVNTKFYSENDGLDSDGPTSTALAICDTHGRLWFPMIDGFAIYDPVNLMKTPVAPLVHIESVTIDNALHKYNGEQFVLMPGTKRVEIKFTGISFDAPERIQFTHQLTNFDEELSPPSYSRSVSYTNISPGKHTFLLNAIDGEGLHSEQAEAMLFVQKPYFYQSIGFWIFAVTALFAAVSGIFYLKQLSMRREQEKLQKMVDDRTAELLEEKENSDKLLRAILPDKIADELKSEMEEAGRTSVIGENFDDVTLLFSDLVSFTKTSSGYTAREIVNALNDLFSRFDDRAKAMGVEKIKTIGDSYMAAAGLPTKNERHALTMIEFAIGMYEDLEDYNRNAKIKFNMRIGLNSGPVTAGVIGKTKFIYDVWGDTVNTASRMESAANPGKIRVSAAVRDRVYSEKIGFTEAIECDVKGKGLMQTYEVIDLFGNSSEQV